MYRENLALLMERFPLLALRAASFDIEEGEQGDPPSLPKEGMLVYLYGLSLDAYRCAKGWLDAAPGRKMIFLENREGRLGALLQTPGAAELLGDLRVDIQLLPKGVLLEKALDALARAYPVRTLEILALSLRKTSYFYSLRLRLLRKTMLAEVIRRDRLHGYQLFSHFLKNAPLLQESFYFNALPGAFANIPAVICGAGPSLSAALPLLKTLEHRALLFACGSAIRACGPMSHFCVAVDPNEEEFFRLKESEAFEVPLLYSTRLHPRVFAAMNGPLGYVRSLFGDVPALWLEEELGLLDPPIGQGLSSEALSVTSLALAAAVFLGCNPIVFAGLDLAYTAKKRYCAEVGAPAAAKQNSLSSADRAVYKRDQKGRKVSTAVRWIMESSSLSHYAKLHPEVQFINATEGGIGFTEVPYRPLETVIGAWTQEFDLRGMVHAKIRGAPLPASAAAISQHIAALQASLQRVIEHLHILTGARLGSQALAELELKEELAFSILFYDIYSLFPEVSRWGSTLELALQYASV